MTPDSALDADIAGRPQARAKSMPGPNANNADMGVFVSEALAGEPDRVALRYGGVSVTRGTLQAAAARIADRLIAADLQKGERVLVDMGPEPDLVAALCGALMAGGTAVPLDPGLSAQRRQAVRSDAAPRIVLSSSEEGVEIAVETGRCARPTPETAFVVYTSGSSGRPKGVEVPHDGYIQRLRHIVEAASPCADDADLIWTPPSFIGFLDEVFYPLCLCVPAVIAREAERKDPQAFADLVASEGVTTFRITPSLLDAFLTASTAEKMCGLRAIFCSGETASAGLQLKVHTLLSETALIGFYGASEAPGAAFHVFDKTASPLTKTVCTPQAFSEFRIVDAHGLRVATGQPGEIWISGCAVARGYLGRPELTAEKFVVEDGQRWYRTGDLGQWLDDGLLEILGRLDSSEVKINGVRVALADVREALQALPGIKDAWVTPVQVAETRDPVLVAHYAAEPGTYEAPALRRLLASRLSSAAVPRFMIWRDGFPLTDNGKLDLQTLGREARDAAIEGEPTSHETYAHLRKPQSAMKRTLERLWCDALFLEQISEDDDFFDLGGDSLRTIRLLIEVEEVFGVSLPNHCLFGPASTISGMADCIVAARRHEKNRIPSRNSMSPKRMAVATIRKVKKFVNRRRAANNARGEVISATGDVDLNEIQRRMQTWTKGWPGRDVGTTLPVYLHRADNEKCPFFYWVNSKLQAEQIAALIGEDVNLFIVRSLNQICDWSVKSSVATDVVAAYTDEILRLVPQGPVILGGNCQGGALAETVAHRLMDRGREVRQLVLLEHEPTCPYPGRVSMFFHAKSLDFNPFHMRPDPEKEWRAIHGDVTWDILPGGHGQTFNRENLPSFAAALRERIQPALVHAAPAEEA